MHRHTYRLDIAYDGSKFFGFRRRPGLRTVESTLLAALRPLIEELPGLAVGGRTDRGVHALRQVVSFYSRSALSLGTLRRSVDAIAPAEIVLRAATEVPRRFHASFSASARSYVYRLKDDELDARRLDALLEPLLGRRCFNAYARRTAPGTDTVVRLKLARASRELDHLRFDFVAPRFLRRMVRVLVATAVREARRKASEDALLRLCDAGDRTGTAAPADPGGLYLAGVDYLI